MMMKRGTHEKWSRKNYIEIPPSAKPFLENIFYFIERGIFLHEIANSVIKMTFFAHGATNFHPFSILTGHTKVESVAY